MARSTSVGQWGASIAGASDGPTAMRASASGSVAFLGSSAYPLRESPDAFAVVRTDGIAGVPVRLENRLVGRTDASGQLLVTDLLSNQKNRIEIDPLGLPLELRPDLTRREVAPRSRSGVLVSFRLRRIRPILAVVQDAASRVLPPGTLGSLRPDRPEFAGESRAVPVGHDGEVYIEDLAEDSILTFALADGPCRVSLRAEALPDPLRRSVLTCVRPSPTEQR